MGVTTEAALEAAGNNDGNVSLSQPTMRPGSDAAYDVEADLRETTDRARLKSLQMSDDLNAYVQEHPVTSLCVAFAAGIITCSIFRR